jgi:hypothetical protein
MKDLKIKLKELISITMLKAMQVTGIYLVWNSLMIDMFNVKPITFIGAFLLAFITKMLFVFQPTKVYDEIIKNNKK